MVQRGQETSLNCAGDSIVLCARLLLHPRVEQIEDNCRSMGAVIARARVRFLVYGLAGWAIDSLFVSAHTGRRRPSSLLNVPIYGLAQPLFEPGARSAEAALSHCPCCGLRWRHPGR